MTLTSFLCRFGFRRRPDVRQGINGCFRSSLPRSPCSSTVFDSPTSPFDFPTFRSVRPCRSTVSVDFTTLPIDPPVQSTSRSTFRLRWSLRRPNMGEADENRATCYAAEEAVSSRLLSSLCGSWLPRIADSRRCIKVRTV